MSNSVNPRTVAQVREWTNLEALVSEYLPLKKSGAQWLISCPWHQESNPSCRVYPDHLHCYSCNTSGDCFSFIRAVEGCTFPEALRRLADRAGIPLVQGDAKPVSRAAMRYAREEADMCRWWWEVQRKSVMDLGRWELHNEEADQEWLACLFRMRQWIDAQGYSERYTIFRERCTAKERETYRALVKDRDEFAAAWLGLAALPTETK